ncbi:hypothetical protein KCP77_16030 [Salmonella enterica subsp. enterica]|nr:hypothetical protein KCP77_16030 [Salmonella enterica subsp. enterica]
MLPLHKSITPADLHDGYQSALRRATAGFHGAPILPASHPASIGQGCLAVSTATAQKAMIGCLRYSSCSAGYGLSGIFQFT